MKLLFLTQTFPRFEGDTAGPFILELARGLVRLGDSVTVLTPHARGVARSWEVDGVVVRSFRYAPESLELVGYSRSLDRDETMKVGAALAAPAYWLGARRAALQALGSERFDLVHAHWVVPNGLLARSLSTRIPVAVGLHGSDVFMAEKAWLRTWVRRSLAATRLLTGCSPELVDRVAALGFDGVQQVIPYGVDCERFHPGDEGRSEWREKLGIPPEATVLLSVGRMATKKGYQVLLPILPEFLRGHPDVHVVLAGGGDRLEEFRTQAADQPRIHFPGLVYRQDLPSLYRSADGFVLPAVHDPAGNVDGLPNVILEAMASGLPVIASGISGIPLAVEDPQTGWLTREGDAAGLSAALGEFMESQERLHRGAAGRRKTEAELTWDIVSARYREAYAGIMGAPATGAP